MINAATFFSQNIIFGSDSISLSFWIKKKNGTKLISKIDESILILLYNSKNFIKFKKRKAIFENIKTLITSTFVHDDDIYSHSHLISVANWMIENDQEKCSFFFGIKLQNWNNNPFHRVFHKFSRSFLFKRICNYSIFYSEFPKKKKVICKPIFQIKINFTDVIENKKISSSFSIQREWSKK